MTMFADFGHSPSSVSFPLPEQDVLRVAVAGGGSWGTALAHLLAVRGHEVTLILRDVTVAHAINTRHENPRYLAGHALHPALRASTEPAELAGRHVWVLAVPCQQLRAYLALVRPWLGTSTVLVNAAKGLEMSSHDTMEQVVRSALNLGDKESEQHNSYAILSGPSFAAEVMECQPTAVVLGCACDVLGARLRQVFSTQWFRCYSSTDVRGVELGGAMKNVMAIAAGMCEGLGFGHNARAALITRGLAEMSRLGTALGAQGRTFMGLSGLGDLTLTCTGDLSRNRQVGLRLGRGEALEHITHSLGMVAEGVKTAEALHGLAHVHKVSAPITAAVCGIVRGNMAVREAVTLLMTRELREE